MPAITKCSTIHFAGTGEENSKHNTSRIDKFTEGSWAKAKASVNHEGGGHSTSCYIAAKDSLLAMKNDSVAAGADPGSNNIRAHHSML